MLWFGGDLGRVCVVCYLLLVIYALIVLCVLFLGVWLVCGDLRVLFFSVCFVLF